jgi:pimeloyl-ACP methyl ester carboxylesterase
MIARTDWVASGRSIEFGSPAGIGRIFVREAGRSDAPAIFFVHGFLSSSWDWAKVEPMLAERFRLGYVDLLGFGASSKPDRRYSLMEQARVVRAAIAALGFERFHLVVHDCGASIAQQLMCEPALDSRIASVTFLNGELYAPLATASSSARVQMTTGLFGGRFATKARFSAALSTLFAARYRPFAVEIDQQWEAFASGGGARRVHRFLRCGEDREFFGPMWESALETSPVPLNFVWGLLDPTAGRAMLAHAISRQSRFPNVTTLPDVGHYPQLEAPERVAASIAAFVDTTPAGERLAILPSI